MNSFQKPLKFMNELIVLYTGYSMILGDMVSVHVLKGQVLSTVETSEIAKK